MPVALREGDGKRELVRPFREGGAQWTPAVATVVSAVGEELKGLLPVATKGDKTLLVQVFEDQKLSRQGFGDVLFVAKTPPSKPVADAKRFETILDPSSAGAP